MSESSKLDRLLEDIITLPSQPTTLARVTELMADPDCSLGEVGRVVSADPAISFKALRLVNSAHYGLPNTVVSIEHAVMLLGLKVIRNLVLSATVFETFAHGAEGLLQHCIASGICMRVMTESLKWKVHGESDDAFVYGLLHDVGKIIFSEYLPEETVEADRVSREKGLPSHLAEREVIGCDHAELGGRLAESWKLPARLGAAIVGHHHMDECPDIEARPVAALLCIADAMCWSSGLESAPVGATPPTVPEQAWTLAQVDARTMPGLCHGFFDALPEVAELVEIAQ